MHGGGKSPPHKQRNMGQSQRPRPQSDRHVDDTAAVDIGAQVSHIKC